MFNLLKSPHTQRIDDLIDRLTSRTINLAEAKELKELLMNGDKYNSPEPLISLAMVMMLSRLDQIIFDKEGK